MVPLRRGGKVVRLGLLATLTLGLLLTGLAPLGVVAQDVTYQVVDAQGDSASAIDSRDFVAAGIIEETGSTIKVQIAIVALESITNPNDLPDLPQIEYEFYFTAGGSSYAAAAIIRVHGPLAATASYELRSVDASTTPPTETTLKAAQGGNYDLANNVVELTISKSDLNTPQEGDVATRTYGAVWFSTFTGAPTFAYTNRTLEDRGPDSGFGDDYVFLGEMQDRFEVTMSLTGPSLANATFETPAQFPFNVSNNGTAMEDLTFNYTLVTGTINDWKVSIAPPKLQVQPHESGRMVLSVRPSSNKVAAGSQLQLFVFANSASNNTTNSVKVTVQFSAGPAPVPPPKNPGKEVVGALVAYAPYILVLVAAVVGLVLVGRVRASRRARKEFDRSGAPAPPVVPPPPTVLGTAGKSQVVEFEDA